MEMLQLFTEAGAIPGCSVSAQERRELQPEEISTLLVECLETTDEEMELIEMRYQQALALMKLENLFAEGQLDCM
jgi:hypothetical protein